MEKIDDACKFTSQLLEHGNTVEILSLKRVVGAQLLHLINNTPKPEVNTSIEFETDIKKFEAAVKVCIATASGNLIHVHLYIEPDVLIGSHLSFI